MRLCAPIPFIAALVLSLCWTVQAQTPGSGATISFSLDFPQSDPSHYSIVVSDNGQSIYRSEARVSRESDEKDPFELHFDASPITKTRIFDLAQRTNYFQGDLEAKK